LLDIEKEEIMSWPVIVFLIITSPIWVTLVITLFYMAFLFFIIIAVLIYMALAWAFGYKFQIYHDLDADQEEPPIGYFRWFKVHYYEDQRNV